LVPGQSLEERINELVQERTASHRNIQYKNENMDLAKTLFRTLSLKTTLKQAMQLGMHL
jgi:hypothetical protein